MTVNFFVSATLIFLLDQVTKKIARAKLGSRVYYRSGSRGLFRIVSNPRIALGFVRDRRAFVFLWAIATFGTVLLTLFITPLQQQFVQFGLGAALGGATGNMVDLIRMGAIVDFINLRIWPVFNVADMAIVIGVAIALLSLV